MGAPEDVSSTADRTEAWLVDSHAARLDEFTSFLRIRSVSALPEHAVDCEAAATWLAQRFAAIGLEHAHLIPTDGHPIVYADWLHAPGAPTILVYSHYDVQPPDPLEAWSSAPFEPTIEGAAVRGRGTADAKAQVMIHLWAAEALLRTRGRLPVNLRVIIEGDEESGSGELEAWLETQRDQLAADLAVVSDSSFFEGNRPSITIGLRGICYLQIDAFGAQTDLHSGANGGAIPNPINALCDVLASLKRADGSVAVAGFYDDVTPLSKRDRSVMAALPFDEEAYRISVGARALTGEAGYTTMERLTARPTLDVCGIWGGFQGPGQKTIIPSEAHAKLSCRLVPTQEPRRIGELLAAHIARATPAGIRIDVAYLSGGIPTVQPIDHPATRAAARALREVFGVEPLFARKGSSIPAAAALRSVFDIPVVLLGFTPPNNRAHAPDEWMDLDNLEKGVRTVARCWEELSGLGPDDLRQAAASER